MVQATRERSLFICSCPQTGHHYIKAKPALVELRDHNTVLAAGVPCSTAQGQEQAGCVEVPYKPR